MDRLVIQSGHVQAAARLAERLAPRKGRATGRDASMSASRRPFGGLVTQLDGGT